MAFERSLQNWLKGELSLPYWVFLRELVYVLGCILPCTNYHRIWLDHPGRSQTQKSPQGFHLAGFQDFDDGSGNHQPRILVELAGVEPASEITTPSALHA